MTALSAMFGQAGGKPKGRQLFTANGTFTPSAALLAAGGWVYVRAKAGGGGGGSGDYGLGAGRNAGGGGGSGAEWEGWLQLSGPATVTIGQGGASNSPGGDTSFGTFLLLRGGRHGLGSRGGHGARRGEDGVSTSRGRGAPGFGGDVYALPQHEGGYGYGAGGGGGNNNDSANSDTRQGYPGSAGFVEIVWFD